MDAVIQASDLLRHYGFDLSGKTSEQIVNQWLQDYEASWIFLAIFEALYQGRYKAISVHQILIFWKRRGEPIYHFNSDFEYLICHQPPQNLLAKKQPQSSLNYALATPIKTKISALKHPNFYSKLKSFMEGCQTQSSPLENISLEVVIESSNLPVESPLMINSLEPAEELIPLSSDPSASETVEPVQETKPSVTRRENKSEFEPPQSASA